MLWKIMVFFLVVIIFALLLKIFYMRKAIREIKRGFSEKLYTDTNTPIMLSSHDKLVSSLANDINVELKELQKQKHRYIQGDKELKNAITNISHDLRTPLTTICGYLSLLDNYECGLCNWYDNLSIYALCQSGMCRKLFISFTCGKRMCR